MSPATLARRYQAANLVGWHEAGHALVAHLRGRQVERVHVGYARDSGETSIASAIYDPLDRALVLLAGDRAERRSVSWLSGMEALGGGDDRAQLALALEELRGDWTLAQLISKTDDLLRQNSAKLERLVRRLDTSSIVRGPEVAELLG